MRILVALLLAFAAQFAHAHKPSDSYLAVMSEGGRLHGQWDIALRDLDFAIGLDADGNGEITWGELRAKHAEISAYALARLSLSADGLRCRLAPTEHLVDEHSDGAYEVMRFSVDCDGNTSPREIEVDYNLFFDLDPSHRGLLRIQHGTGTLTAILGPERPKQKFSLAAASRLGQFLDYGREGIWHILIGFDHILFLVCLLLPAVFFLGKRGWEPADRFAPVFWDVLRIVTAFTLAHSITLLASVLEVISLPSDWIEVTIALSIMLSACLNLQKRIRISHWKLALVFGLIHGMGFANGLRELGLSPHYFIETVLAFNIGVELGQIAAVAAVGIPVIWLAKETSTKQRIMTYGSLGVLLVSFIWLVQRLMV